VRCFVDGMISTRLRGEQMNGTDILTVRITHKQSTFFAEFPCGVVGEVDSSGVLSPILAASKSATNEVECEDTVLADVQMIEERKADRLSWAHGCRKRNCSITAVQQNSHKYKQLFSTGGRTPFIQRSNEKLLACDCAHTLAQSQRAK
jgi:hypothetical protein